MLVRSSESEVVPRRQQQLHDGAVKMLMLVIQTALLLFNHHKTPYLALNVHVWRKRRNQIYQRHVLVQVSVVQKTKAKPLMALNMWPNLPKTMIPVLNLQRMFRLLQQSVLGCFALVMMELWLIPNSVQL